MAVRVNPEVGAPDPARSRADSPAVVGHSSRPLREEEALTRRCGTVTLRAPTAQAPDEGTVMFRRPPEVTARSRLALALGALVVGSGVVVFPLGAGPDGTVMVGAVSAVGYGTAGALLARARPRNLLGWLLLLIGAFSGVASAAAASAVSPLVDAGAGRTFSAWLGSWLWFPALSLVPTVVLLLYPSGVVGSRARRALLVVAALGISAVSAALALSADAVDDIVPGLENPLAAHQVSVVLVALGFSLLLPSLVLCVADTVRRLRRSRSPEREQLTWLLITAVVFLVGSLTPWMWLRALVQAAVPIAVAVGVVRHRLLDLQVVVRRTLLFAGLTAAVVVVFVGCTAALSGFVDGGPLPVALGAALVAVALTPIRDRLQRAVDRLVYGDRSDPVRAVASLGRHVAEHDDATLAGQVLDAVTIAVKSPCAVLIDAGGVVRAQAGVASDGEPLRLPLQVAARDVGRLLVYPRTARDGWSREDKDLLDLLAQQVAVVAHVAHLNAELARSRDGVLTATADERSRLRQEMHDGLGPALSGIALGLEAAEMALTRDPQRAMGLVQRLREETQSAGREVRLLVEGLRPAALDGQGLEAALVTFTEGMSAVTEDRLALTLRMSRPLPALPHDVDAAAYRIVTEAVTNVVRHSGAQTCTVEVQLDGTRLCVQVDDDGTGLPTQPRDGVGLSSMRRRAAELGGTWSALPRPGGGTRVVVELPLRSTADRPPTTAPAGLSA